MTIAKLALLVIVLATVIVYLRSVNKELALLATVCACALVVSLGLDMLLEVFAIYERLSTLGNINSSSLRIIIKVTAIAYVVEFSAGIVEEFGMRALADKLIFVGKIVIVALAFPVFEALIKVIEGLL